MAISVLGGGNRWEERHVHAADSPVEIAGKKGTFTAFALDADIPELLRKGAMGFYAVR